MSKPAIESPVRTAWRRLFPAALCALLLGSGAAIAADPAGGLKPDIVYAEAGGEKLLLDAHVPEGEGPFPVAVLIHGGGWGSGDRKGDITPLMEPLSAAKFTWFSIDYRLAPKHRWPACRDDVNAALRWVKAHAAEYKGDPKRVAVLGYSAGGHLATLAAVLAGDDTRVQAVVGLAAPTDMPADTARRGGLSASMQALLDRPKEVDEATAKTLAEISPINHLKAGLPPFLLIHGTDDQSVPYPQSVNLQAKLGELKVPCELVTIQGAGHRIRDWKNLNPGYLEKMTSWLNATLAPAK